MAGTAILAVTMALVAPSFSWSAQAHHGDEGPARLYLDTVRLEPKAEKWAIGAAVNYTNSGRPAPGFLVGATASGPDGATFGPVSLGDLDADGWYETGLGPLPAGDWSLTLEVSDAPGGDERAIPITRTWTVALQPGQDAEVVGQQPPGGGAPSDSSGVLTPLMLGTGIAALLGGAGAWLSRRRGGYPKRRASSAA